MMKLCELLNIYKDNNPKMRLYILMHVSKTNIIQVRTLYAKTLSQFSDKRNAAKQILTDAINKQPSPYPISVLADIYTTEEKVTQAVTL